MSEVIFAIPRTEYGSYSDLYRLIDLSGYQHIFVDEIAPASDNAFILTCRNGELGDGWPNARARIILWDFEHRTEPQAPIPGITDYWHMDAYEAKLLDYKYVPCGGHPGLRLTSPSETPVAPFDTLYYGYMVPRREKVAHDLRLAGVNAFITNSLWGEQRDRYLNSAYTVIHIHQLENAPAVPILRMVVAAAYSLPVITEQCADYGIFNPDVLMATRYSTFVSDIADTIRQHYGNERLKACGPALHQLLCEEWTFRRSIEASL